ncbi:MerR family transcriptional regulator [Tepidibacter hydrothermalis]|uniref:MerR family transcriptional regulator n=1 Tax=Tepidibacter hydrothermalis TaxID=3036126 RepID=A0ABY8EBE1_9FIRM|nr:MerR family transcriptional regulator [Tepidibacter hydrothermalis]WFD10250.1 MerR family transcriptional regulator [Tepidibacter hydrothermalis]
MKDKLSIGEFAKLRNLTTETLRHYDRIGLLKPIKVDPKTGYRYYSILQYEELGTIKELRELGMSIDEIKKYFDNRNLEQSVNILRDKHEELKNRIKELQQLEESIDEKIKHLEEISKEMNFEDIVIKGIKEREIITFDKSIKNEIDLSYICLKLENELKEIAPIVASNRYGAIIKQKDIELNNYIESLSMFIFIRDRDNIDENHIKKIPKGTYACMYYKGSIWDIGNSLKKMLEYIEEQGYTVCGDALQISQIDISVTDKKEEVLYEIQIPIERNLI